MAEERAYERGFAVRFSREGCKSSTRKFRDSFFSVAPPRRGRSRERIILVYACVLLLPEENLIAHENYNDRTQLNDVNIIVLSVKIKTTNVEIKEQISHISFYMFLFSNHELFQ